MAPVDKPKIDKNWVKISQGIQFEGDLRAIIGELEDFIIKAPHYQYIEREYEYDDYTSYYLCGYRDPTSEELEKRKADRAKVRERNRIKKEKDEAAELKRYLELKAKFENKPATGAIGS